jgi:hypothetical protein
MAAQNVFTHLSSQRHLFYFFLVKHKTMEIFIQKNGFNIKVELENNKFLKSTYTLSQVKIEHRREFLDEHSLLQYLEGFYGIHRISKDDSVRMFMNDDEDDKPFFHFTGCNFHFRNEYLSLVIEYCLKFIKTIESFKSPTKGLLMYEVKGVQRCFSVGRCDDGYFYIFTHNKWVGRTRDPYLILNYIRFHMYFCRYVNGIDFWVGYKGWDSKSDPHPWVITEDIVVDALKKCLVVTN